MFTDVKRPSLFSRRVNNIKNDFVESAPAKDLYRFKIIFPRVFTIKLFRVVIYYGS
jgi:hypothetical protein